jgi:hypothetical protein
MKTRLYCALFLIMSSFLLAGNVRSLTTKGIYLRTDIVKGAHFDSLLIKSKNAGINSIVFDIKDMKGRIYIDIEDCPTLITRQGDLKIDLKSTVEKIHNAGMIAIARMVVFHNMRAAQADSTICPKDSLGKRWVEIPQKGPQWLDPSIKSVQEDMFSLIDLTVKGGVDEIQFDYIRFPTQGKISDAIFYYMTEDSIEAEADTTYRKRDKVDIIEDFIRKISSKYQRKNIRFTADIFAIVSWQNSLDIQATGQDISRMSKYLDALHPMIYSSHFANNFGYRDNVHNEPYNLIFQGIKSTQRKADPKCKVLPYIQANSWQVNYKKEYIAAQVAACRDAKADGYILWNATINYQSTLNWLAEINNPQ